MGKVSHSGYHEIEMVFRLLRAGWTPITKPCSARVHSSFVKPTASLRHLPRERLVALFGPEYETLARHTDQELFQIADRLGEMDASLSWSGVKKSKVRPSSTCSTTLSLPARGSTLQRISIRRTAA